MFLLESLLWLDWEVINPYTCDITQCFVEDLVFVRTRKCLKGELFDSYANFPAQRALGFDPVEPLVWVKRLSRRIRGAMV